MVRLHQIVLPTGFPLISLRTSHIKHFLPNILELCRDEEDKKNVRKTLDSLEISEKDSPPMISSSLSFSITELSALFCAWVTRSSGAYYNSSLTESSPGGPRTPSLASS